MPGGIEVLPLFANPLMVELGYEKRLPVNDGLVHGGMLACELSIQRSVLIHATGDRIPLIGAGMQPAAAWITA